jgi:hypothetical protein
MCTVLLPPIVSPIAVNKYIYICINLFPVALQPNAGHGLIFEVFQITHNDAAQSVGLFWTSDQLVTETST